MSTHYTGPESGKTQNQGDQIGRHSPLGRLFTLGNVLKIAEVALILGLLYSTATAARRF
jgi:hypothetical protein